MSTPAISMIVLSWNGRAMLADCLASLAAQTRRDSELIVVDNGSADGTAAYVRATWPQARLLALPSNRGFSGGVNAGIHVARGETIVLLNNDALAEPGFLAELVAPLERDQGLGASAGIMTFAHWPERVASAGIVFHQDGVALDGRIGAPVAALPQAPVAAWGASGGAVAYRRAALADVGIFDEGYFAYLEDADLAWRLRGRGWGTVLAPGARARHIYSATGGEGSPLKTWLLARNRWRLLGRSVPAGLLARHWAAIMGYDLLACAQAAARGTLGVITGRLAAWRDWPSLRAQGRRIQARYTQTPDQLDAELLPARTPWAIWRQQQALGAILAKRREQA